MSFLSQLSPRTPHGETRLVLAPYCPPRAALDQAIDSITGGLDARLECICSCRKLRADDSDRPSILETEDISEAEPLSTSSTREDCKRREVDDDRLRRPQGSRRARRRDPPLSLRLFLRRPCPRTPPWGRRSPWRGGAVCVGGVVAALLIAAGMSQRFVIAPWAPAGRPRSSVRINGYPAASSGAGGAREPSPQN